MMLLSILNPNLLEAAVRTSTQAHLTLSETSVDLPPAKSQGSVERITARAPPDSLSSLSKALGLSGFLTARESKNAKQMKPTQSLHTTLPGGPQN